MSESGFNNIVITLMRFYQEKPTPDQDQIEIKAKEFANSFDYEGSIDEIVEEVITRMDIAMDAGESLIDMQSHHDERWVEKREDIPWVYSDAYAEYLRNKGWSPRVVQSHTDVSNRVLSLLQDPTSQGKWDRRGLVIGHVQSGKTSHYIGLVSKAADAGYKLIIVIAGVHNILRKQTQERIDEGFIGRTSDPYAPKRNIGVGHKILGSDYPHPVTITNIYKDFNKQVAEQSGWKLNDFSKPIVLVIKKNVHTLRSLHDWLQDLNARADGKIEKVPMLMIDDEADHASINTSREDIDPTKTNTMLRKILSMFNQSCYVGYTATPFANIFINPESYGDSGEDLFPRHFIHCLDAPTNYFGPEKVFLDDESSDRVIREIDDAENYISYRLKKDDDIQELPPSLYRAIQEFILIRTIRNLRGDKNQHCSMIVNVSRFIKIQNQVKDLIGLYITKINAAVKANHKMPEGKARKDRYMRELEEIYNQEFVSSVKIPWGEVKENLFVSVNSMRSFAINSASDQPLEYKKYEEDGSSLTVIAVGGLSLSRGLTVEGLCVSYMYRNTRMYDTLMQMGRWFGYRPNYEDLCRVYLPKESINWYSHISEASESLMLHVKQMRRDGLGPKEFGLYVKSHPDRLLVTAPGKMRNTETVSVRQNFSGGLRESYVLPDDEGTNEKNRQLIAKYWKSNFGKSSDLVKNIKKGWFIQDVDSEVVQDFLRNFLVHRAFLEQRNAHVEYLRLISEKYRTCDVLLVSPEPNPDVSTSYRLNSQIRTKADIHTKGWWIASKHKVSSKSDEKGGLTDEQIDYAWSLAKKDRENQEIKNKGLEKKNIKQSDVTDRFYREVRKKPLLLLHYLDLGENQKQQKSVPAYGISFPYGGYSKTVEVVVNKDWIDHIHGSIDYDGMDEDDYDEIDYNGMDEDNYDE